MKRLALISILILGFGCSKPRIQPTSPDHPEIARFDGPIIPVTTTKTRNAPSWIDNSDRDGKLTAVGIAEKNPLGNKALQREVAVNRGIAVLGKKVNVEIDQLYQELQLIVARADGDKKAPTQALNELNNTIRTLVSTRIRGAIIPYYWTDPADGTLYVLVQLNDLAGCDILKTAALSQPSLKEAVRELDRTLQARK